MWGFFRDLFLYFMPKFGVGGSPCGLSDSNVRWDGDFHCRNTDINWRDALIDLVRTHCLHYN